ncbi:MAG: Bax inhibitor-1 family protein [Chthoniobacter sp.]|nr:Bax inhibitor-1 family protein [Chthoniobacter sp.]
MFKSDVFDRENSAADEISASLYNFIIGAVLLWGFFLTGVVQHQFAHVHFGWPLMIGYFVSSFVGIMLSRSQNALISLLGYHFIVVPTGILLGPFVNALSPQVLQNTLFLTGGVTFGMMGGATFFPALFLKLGRALFFSLIALLVVSLLSMFFFPGAYTIIDYVAAGIFSLYIAYDYARAQAIPKTMDNAVDVCIALYLDIINLFIRLASILSRRD